MSAPVPPLSPPRLVVIVCLAAAVAWAAGVPPAFALPMFALRAHEEAPPPAPPVAADETPTDRARVEREPVLYGRDVRPLLSDRCFQCHGAHAEARRADLRLDVRESAVGLRDGVAAIVPGDVSASELVRRITSTDPDEVMPPPSANKRPLSADERQALVRWIEQGATYEPHWAFIAPLRPPLPQVADAAWPLGALDHFVLARLEAAGIAPSPPADPAVQVRRLVLDLTGLPPEPAELDAFLADPSDAAYETLARRLLSEEPYRTRAAEHLASPWLDAARYADTIGIHTDNGRQLWPWRDWVLRALRDNMPFDRFVTEQLAGDLLPGASVSQQVATGFHRAHVITDEGGAIDEEYLVEYAADRAETTAKVFLGLTVNCARCHDHKFDPITMDDYYGLFAFFNSNDEPGLYSQSPDTQRAFEPRVDVPSPEQEAEIAVAEEALAGLMARLEAPLPGEDAAYAAFRADSLARAGVDWSRPELLEIASSDERVGFAPQDDGSWQAEGPMPEVEDYVVRLGSARDDLRAVLVELMSTPGADTPGAGRDFHGNVVLTDVKLEQRGGARTVGDDAAHSTDEPAWEPVPLRWAWADHTQRNRDYQPGNMLDDDPSSGWAADGNEDAGPRALVLLSDREFGHAGGELRLTLSFRSPFVRHSAGRLRFGLSPLGDTAPLPVSLGRWYRAGPFGATLPDTRATYDESYGPERLERLDTEASFGPEDRRLSFFGELVEGVAAALPDLGATLLVRRVWSPDARSVPVSLGSDDGLQVYVNGERVFENRVDRGVAPDQDAAELSLRPGLNVVALKIVNTGGPGGAYFRADEPDGVLTGELGAALLPDDAITDEQREQLALAWRRGAFDEWRELDDQRAAAEQRLEVLRAALPQAMVMRELEQPRQAYVLMRGQYDHPDPSRPVARATPGFLPPLSADASADRLGLARWLTSAEQPLFARVTVNRFWEQLFGRGLVATPDNFGYQGAWPSHPELLDWLAVSFRESGWDVRELLLSMVTSATYRQSSAARPELTELDPEGALLARFPTRRLSAEQIRDLALHTSGLLVERLGGPSVKPYQPEGMWREVSMLQSNTRDYVVDAGEGLWRRSLYTYWKRAVPPPSLQTFDAPTRESCVVSRARTNTPLQALVLWNDVQFVEAARALATRCLEQDGDDEQRLVSLFRRCTARQPDGEERVLLKSALEHFRARYADDAEAALALVSVGDAPLPGESPADAEGTPMGAVVEPVLDPAVALESGDAADDDPADDDAADDNAAPPAFDASELAAWTMVSSAVLNLHETLTQH